MKLAIWGCAHFQTDPNIIASWVQFSIHIHIPLITKVYHVLTVQIDHGQS